MQTQKIPTISNILVLMIELSVCGRSYMALLLEWRIVRRMFVIFIMRLWLFIAFVMNMPG